MVQIPIVLSRTHENVLKYFIIELQGDLQFNGDKPFAGRFLGDLHFTKEGTPLLIIGHHILYGKCATLEKPLAVMVKSVEPLRTGDDTNATEANAMDTDLTTTYTIKAIVKQKLLFKTRPKPIITNVPKKS